MMQNGISVPRIHEHAYYGWEYCACQYISVIVYKILIKYKQMAIYSKNRHLSNKILWEMFSW